MERNNEELIKANLKAFKLLRKKYKQLINYIKSSDIPKDRSLPVNYLHAHTGFGNSDTCSLCKAITRAWNPCEGHCLYTIHTSGICDMNSSYNLLEYADTFGKLLIALKARRKFMRKIIKLEESYLNNLHNGKT